MMMRSPDVVEDRVEVAKIGGVMIDDKDGVQNSDAKTKVTIPIYSII